MGDDTGVIVVAGGSGRRMGTTVPKQFLELCGRPVLMHTVERFRSALPEAKIVVVLPETEISRWRELCEKHNFGVEHTVEKGGETRFHSVRNGLRHLSACEYVGVQDGVRPLVSRTVILSALNSAQEYGAAVPVVAVTDSLREIVSVPENSTSEPAASRIADRTIFRGVQTPQFFRGKMLRTAYETAYRPSFTDDASVVEAAGYRVALSEGDSRNIKITAPADLIIAEALLRAEENATKIR